MAEYGLADSCTANSGLAEYGLARYSPPTKLPFNPPRRAPHSLCICITAWSADGHGRLTNGTRAPAAAENLRVVFNCASARAVALVAVLRDHGVRSGRGAGAGGWVRRYLLWLSSFLTPLSYFGAKGPSGNLGGVFRRLWS